mgnify:CR=1 FL=1
MTQPIDREPMTTPYITQSQLDRAFPVAHSRKDAEPVAKIISSGPADFPLLQWLSAELSFREPIGSLLYTHPPEADKLLQQALEALEYRLQQTRPIHQADVVMESIRTYLENKA